MPSNGPELRALPDTPALSERASLEQFARDLESPEYRQALLMALSGTLGAPAAAKAQEGALSRLSDTFLGTAEQQAFEAAAEQAYRARFTPAEWDAMMQNWAKFQKPASMEGYASSHEAARASEAPIQGILKALQLSLGQDLPKTAAMAAGAR